MHNNLVTRITAPLWIGEIPEFSNLLLATSECLVESSNNLLLIHIQPQNMLKPYAKEIEKQLSSLKIPHSIAKLTLTDKRVIHENHIRFTKNDRIEKFIDNYSGYIHHDELSNLPSVDLRNLDLLAKKASARTGIRKAHGSTSDPYMNSLEETIILLMEREIKLQALLNDSRRDCIAPEPSLSDITKESCKMIDKEEVKLSARPRDEDDLTL